MLAAAPQSARFFLAAVLLLASAKLAFPQNSQSLKEILAASGLPLSNSKLENADRKITGGAQVDDVNQFVIAYYLDDGSGMLNPPLFIDRFDRRNKQWRSAALPDAQTKSPSVDDTCFG